MRTIDLTREESMALRNSLESILKSHGIHNSYIQKQFIEEAISNFEIEDMPKSTREEKIQKLFHNIKIALRSEIAKYETDKEKKYDDSIKEKIYQQINSPKIDPRTDFGKGFYYKSKDGGKHTSMEAVEQANNTYWDSMMIYPSPTDEIKYEYKKR